MSYDIISSRVKETIDALWRDPKVRSAMDFLVRDQAVRTEENKEIALVQGETGKETQGRSPLFQEKLSACGAEDCVIDGMGNVCGYIYGSSPGKKPLVMLETHLDTVFLEDTPLSIVEREGKIFCPGIGDNASAMAQTLSILRAIRHAGLRPVGVIMPTGAAREEGKGNFDGMRFLLQKRNDIDTAVIVDGGGTERIGWGGIGIKRYEFIYRGPRGHSWHIGGAPSALHAMGRAIAKIADIPMISDPKTTVNAGLVSGGSTVGAVAGEARVQVDLRSSDAGLLEKLAAKVLAAAEAGAAEENDFKKDRPERITLETICFGDMPAGKGLAGHVSVQAARYLTELLGKTPIMEGGTCTNGNITVDRGIPTVIMGHGGYNGENHSLNEWYEPLDNYIAAQRAMLMVFALAGLDGVTEPLLGTMHT